jgi:uncharacterized protein
MNIKNVEMFGLSIPFRLRIFLMGSAGLIVLSILVGITFATGARLLLSVEDYNLLISSNQFLVAINFMTYFILTMTFFLWLSKTTLLKNIFLSFFNITKLKKALVYFLILYGMLILAGIIYETLGIVLEDNTNQDTITQLTIAFPFLSIITFVFLGPIAEEITYRLGLFGLLHRYNRWIAFILTALVFGFIHFDYGSSNYVNELLNMPLYILAGVVFAYIYEREGFEVATLTHIINNGFSIMIIWIISWTSSSL